MSRWMYRLQYLQIVTVEIALIATMNRGMEESRRGMEEYRQLHAKWQAGHEKALKELRDMTVGNDKWQRKQDRALKDEVTKAVMDWLSGRGKDSQKICIKKNTLVNDQGG